MPEIFERGDFDGLRFRHRRPTRDGRQPLLVFLHGVGERGADNERQLSYSFFEDPHALFGGDVARRYPCHVLAPQAPADDQWVAVTRWDSPRVELTPQPTRSLAAAAALVAMFAARLDVDADRIYLVGLSMGAFGVFDLLARAPERYAAAVAVCGAGDLARAAAFAAVPVWLAHGALDRGVPVARSREMAAALAAAGGAPVYREYAELGHDVWSQALADPDLPAWLFARARG